MNGSGRSPARWVALALLVALVATNAVFLALLRTGGPLIGLTCYAILLALVWRGRQRDYQTAAIAGLAGLLVHATEVVAVGWTAYPVLLALNLILPALLAPAAWLAGRNEHRACGS
jgi:hypothetical protein